MQQWHDLVEDSDSGQAGQSNTGAADAYWAATKDYWAAVRDMWADVAEANGGITIEEEAETGTVISGRLLTIGSELQEGKIAQDAAIAEARALIEGATTPGAASAERPPQDDERPGAHARGRVDGPQSAA